MKRRLLILLLIMLSAVLLLSSCAEQEAVEPTDVLHTVAFYDDGSELLVSEIPEAEALVSIPYAEGVWEDEDGNVLRFQFLELVTVDETPYAVLMPEDDPDGELGVVIVEVVDIGKDTEHYDAVTDDALNDRIFEQFRKEFSDKYDFED